MGTTATTLTGAIAEVKSSVDTITSNSLVWKVAPSTTTAAVGQVWKTIPSDANEIYIDVWITNSSTTWLSVGFIVPMLNNVFWGSAGDIHDFVNYYPSGTDGYVKVGIRNNDGTRQVMLRNAYSANTNVSSTVSWRVYYR